MIVDFQHHFTPRAFFKEDSGDRMELRYEVHGVPAYSSHALLYDLDEHVAMMDEAGIDAAVLSSGHGMGSDLDACRMINDAVKKAERDYPGRFIGIAHAPPLGGADSIKELGRCVDELGYGGAVITSEIEGRHLDDPALDPFWEEASRLRIYVFIHPALDLIAGRLFDADDLARSVGREFSLVVAAIRLINGGVLDRHPGLTIHMAHLCGGIASLMGRVRSFQDRKFWGTEGNERHGRLPAKEFDFYLRERFIFDTAGFGGDIGAVKTALVEIPAGRIVFATDYPQEIRRRPPVKRFVEEIRALGEAGEAILSGNVAKLLPKAARSAA